MAEQPMVAWLETEIDRVEQLARAAEDEFVFFDVSDEQVAEHYQGAGSPIAVLSRVATDRQILAEHAHGSMTDERDETECRTCSGPTPGFSGSWPMEWPCRTVRLLAEGYGWTEAGS